jgi:chromosomal replication initiation ATPase DnaA
MTFKLRNINKYAFNKQMALPLTFKTFKNRENFIISKCNEEAVRLIENSSFWQNKRKINSIPAAIIFGPKGSGKTHLSYMFKEYNRCEYLSSLSSFNLDKIEEGKKFILDDFIPGEKYPSELVMHFLNRVTYQDGSVLFLSNQSPSNMDWKLDDLNSRIRSLISSKINLPDDVLLYSFMVKYSNDKKLLINDKQLLYILKRLDRNFGSVISVIDKLDIYSLEIKEKISYKIIKTILNEIET